VQHFHGYEGVIPSVNRDTLNLDLEKEEIEEIFASHAEDLTNEHLVLLIENPEESCDEKGDVLFPKTLTLKRMSLAFSRVD
jgi:hypothetical protein